MTLNRQSENLRLALRKRVHDGLPVEEAARILKEEGVTIAEAIKLIRELYELSLGEAKSCVTRNPAWEGTASAADALHEELLRDEE